MTTRDIDHLFARARVSEPYFDGNAFTSAVMAQLPRPRELAMWKKNAIVLAATVLGTVPAMLNLPFKSIVTSIVPTVQTVPFMATAALVMFAISYGVAWAAQKDVI